MNRWDTFWRSIDRARLVIRVMLFVVFFALFQYISFVTQKFFGIIETAQQNDSPEWAGMVPILTAVTAFAAANVKVIVDLVQTMWKSWSQGGTDWDNIESDQ